MIDYWFTYIDGTGRIISRGRGTKGVFSPVIVDENEILAWKDAPRPSEQYYDPTNDQFLVREVLSFDKTTITADGEDVAILDGLPDPCVVRIDDVKHTITGGRLELSIDVPGTYRVHIREDDAFPAQEFNQEIVAE